MHNSRDIFFRNLAPTSPAPLGLEIERAEGHYLFGRDGMKYLDLISGISVSSIGHRHPAVLEAIRDQLDRHLHLMVYGEYIQSAQVELAALLAELLPPRLSCAYFVNSGTEAVEGALKLARRHTGRTEFICMRSAYHGSTLGALSVMGNERMKNAFRPLIPGTRIIEFNDESDLNSISENTACVITEPVQGEAGVRVPSRGYLKKLRERCSEMGALLILDEAQTGLGRTGSMFAFEQQEFVPDILLLAKALGGGMPLGAFIASRSMMGDLADNPPLGHITTFGGHPVSCAAALASLQELRKSGMIGSVARKEALFRKGLSHEKVVEVRSFGLMMAVELGDAALVQNTIRECIGMGILTDWLLFCDTALRIAPPLTITEEEITGACGSILACIEQAVLR